MSVFDPIRSNPQVRNPEGETRIEKRLRRQREHAEAIEAQQAARARRAALLAEMEEEL